MATTNKTGLLIAVSPDYSQWYLKLYHMPINQVVDKNVNISHTPLYRYQATAYLCKHPGPRRQAMGVIQ